MMLNTDAASPSSRLPTAGIVIGQYGAVRLTATTFRNRLANLKKIKFVTIPNGIPRYTCYNDRPLFLNNGNGHERHDSSSYSVQSFDFTECITLNTKQIITSLSLSGKHWGCLGLQKYTLFKSAMTAKSASNWTRNKLGLSSAIPTYLHSPPS